VIVVTVMLLLVFQPWDEVLKEISEAAVITRVLPGDFQGAGRVELWVRAIYWIQDSPFTGIGMNNFRKMMQVLYHRDVASAHNHILQAALDLGIPGMVAYVGIWSAMARLLWMGCQSTYRLRRLVAMGLGAGLLAQLVYQTPDAIPLGAKVGIFWWMVLGLAVSLFRLVEREGVIERRPRVPEWMVLLLWVLFSLLSILVIEGRPYLGLGIGIVGGVALGYYAVESYLSQGATGWHKRPRVEGRSVVSSG
jgi:hypothetical protein